MAISAESAIKWLGFSEARETVRKESPSEGVELPQAAEFRMEGKRETDTVEPGVRTWRMSKIGRTLVTDNWARWKVELGDEVTADAMRAKASAALETWGEKDQIFKERVARSLETRIRNMERREDPMSFGISEVVIEEGPSEKIQKSDNGRIWRRFLREHPMFETQAAVIGTLGVAVVAVAKYFPEAVQYLKLSGWFH